MEVDNYGMSFRTYIMLPPHAASTFRQDRFTQESDRQLIETVLARFQGIIDEHPEVVKKYPNSRRTINCLMDSQCSLEKFEAGLAYLSVIDAYFQSQLAYFDGRAHQEWQDEECEEGLFETLDSCAHTWGALSGKERSSQSHFAARRLPCFSMPNSSSTLS